MNDSLTKRVVSGIKAGDNSCLEELITEHKGYFVHGMRKKTGCSEEEAEGLFIDAILELRNKVLSCKVENLLNVKSYLFGICYNSWLKRQKKQSLVWRSEEEVRSYYYEQSLGDDFDYLFESESEYKSELMSIAKQAMEKLNEKCRSIINLFYIEKQNMTEIADLMNFSSADVAKNTKARCFKKLTEIVAELT